MSEGFAFYHPPQPLSFFHVRKETTKKRAGVSIPLEINYMALNVDVTHPVDMP